MYKILIVDDNPKNIQVAANFLSGYNYEIEYADNGFKAISLLEDYFFDLILMDVMMPGMDGFEACCQIKKMNGKSEIPIIFLTAKTDTESISKGFEVGGVDYISKPFNTTELLARVKTHIALQQSQKELAFKNKYFTDSIHYASLIQKALLPSESTMNKLFKNHFLIYEPKDIISGDFYWLNEHDNLITICVADCTGHGVPGAFMSVLGITILNELGIYLHNISSGQILDIMREKIKSSWEINDENKNQNDAIDLSLCKIDTESLQMEASSAFNSVFVFRENELIELKGDRQPIGHYSVETNFTTHNFQLQKGDCIYLFSDGYPDQIGELSNKKMKKGNFVKLLYDIQGKAIAEQKEILIDQLQQWRGSCENTDDIIILGFEIA